MTFGELFQEISFDYESKYEPQIYIEAATTEEDRRVVTFYKTTITSDGIVARKGNQYTYDPSLFWKVELMAKLLLDDPTVKVLYG